MSSKPPFALGYSTRRNQRRMEITRLKHRYVYLYGDISPICSKLPDSFTIHSNPAGENGVWLMNGVMYDTSSQRASKHKRIQTMMSRFIQNGCE